ncbi:MAG: N-acetyl-gamma-glutamyl-phosphate reductase [Christensenellaceae bacterium]|jgi:N-acetyl-gamma-glutamyl-phosphate reductase|nr:N-acetyl-gamma-glutamyl-phosphate reductase [Christensenellaceae bacterium]
MQKVFIDGQEGTTGLQIKQRILSHGGFTLLEIDEEKRKDTAERARLINESDITVLCLPDAAASEAVALCTNPDTKIVDASTAHRTLTGWVYGLPELSHEQRSRIITSKRVAVPGCYASGFISLVAPLVRKLPKLKEFPFSCYGLSGYSGAGKKAIEKYSDSASNAALSAPRFYALGQEHKHLKEMRLISDIDFAPLFVPTICSFYSGMAIAVPIHLEVLNCLPERLVDIYKQHYANSEIIRVNELNIGTAPDNQLSAARLADKDYMEISVFTNRQRATLVASYDNLGKGASGAAMQCINLMSGFPETHGLRL